MDLDGLGRTRSVMALIVRLQSESGLLVSNCLRYLTITPTSLKVEYLGSGGLSLDTPLSIQTTNGCYPTEWPSSFE